MKDSDLLLILKSLERLQVSAEPGLLDRIEELEAERESGREGKWWIDEGPENSTKGNK